MGGLYEVPRSRLSASAGARVRAALDRRAAVRRHEREQKDQEYFSDGLAEELLNSLAKIKGLRVVARTSSFQFKGKNRGPAQSREKLNVAHVLEGSVRKQGDRVRITAQLIEAADFHLWSETYDRELTDTSRCRRETARRPSLSSSEVVLVPERWPTCLSSGKDVSMHIT